MMTLDDHRIAGTQEALATTVISTTAQLAELKDQWRILFETSPSAGTPLRFEWVWNWWNIFGPIYGNRGTGLRIITFRRSGKLVGILPLYEFLAGPAPLPMRRLRFITTGAAEFEETCAEYLNLLHAPGEEIACVDALVQLLERSSELRWDELDLADMPDNSPLLALKDRLAGSNRRIKLDSSQICYISNLEGGMEQYFKGLSGGTRKKARKMLRDLGTEGFRFEIASTAQQAGEFFDELVRIHRQRWEAEGLTGSFAARHGQFHKSVAVELAPKGEAIVARLSHNGSSLALVYLHRVGNKVDAYQLGVDHGTDLLRSPGTALQLALMQTLSERGVITYDHLSGFNRFKQDYAKTQRNVAHLTITKPNVRSRIHSAADFSHRAMRKAIEQPATTSQTGIGAARAGVWR